MTFVISLLLILLFIKWDCFYKKCALHVEALDKKIFLKVKIVLSFLLIFLAAWVLTLGLSFVTSFFDNVLVELDSILKYWCGENYTREKILVAFFSVMTLYMANFSLSKYYTEYKRKNDLEEINSLFEIRNLLSKEDFKRIHLKLEMGKYTMPKITETKAKAETESETKADSETEVEAEKMDLYDYLGSIELAGILVKRGVISMSQFINQFGYRVTNIMECKDLMDSLNGPDSVYWSDLLWIIEEVKKFKNR